MKTKTKKLVREKAADRIENPNLGWRGCNPEYLDPKFIIPQNSAYTELRMWQPTAYIQLRDVRFGLAVAFCGSGKTFLQVALAIHDVVRSKFTQKQLCVVPQQHIHEGFVSSGELKYITMKLDGEVYEWKVQHNFCGDEKAVLNGLKKWLLTPSKNLGKKYVGGNTITGLNAVASHQALGIVWNKMLNEKQKRRAIHHLTLRIDEAHHISGVYDVSDCDDLSDLQKALLDEERTTLGDICSLIMNSKDETAKLHLATATPFRGDRAIILTPQVQKKFSIYYLDWIEHFKTLGIEKFELDYVEYDGDPITKVVAKIKAEPNEYHLVILPSTGSRWRKTGKIELQKLLKKLRKIIPEDRILDLVTPETQDKNKKKLLAEPKNEKGEDPKFSVVIACMLCREGTDWCPCSRLHNTACENSITLAIQTIGRPFRRFPGKTEVRIHHYIRKFTTPKKGMTKREFFSDRTNHILICMQLDEMMNPIILPKIKSGEERNEGSGTGSRTTLAEMFGDQWQNAKKYLVEEIECLEEKDKAGIDQVISDIMRDHRISDEDQENVRFGLWALAGRMLSPEIRKLGPGIEYFRENGLDLVVEKIRNGSIYFHAKCSSTTYEVIREILKNNKVSFAERVEAAFHRDLLD